MERLDSLCLSCEKKQDAIKELFSHCKDTEAKYQKILELGKALAPLNPEHKKEENLVHGCQSTVYLHVQLIDGKAFIEGESDALLSSGLVALLISAYNREPPEAILKCPPKFLDELKLKTSLSPSRANGLYHIHLRIKQEAIKLIVKRDLPR